MESIAKKEILPVLETIEKYMIDNDAGIFMTVFYLTYLCYRGAHGGDFKTEQGSEIEDALRVFNSGRLYRWNSGMSLEINQERERVFLSAPYGHDDYVEAFHLFIKEVDGAFDYNYDELDDWQDNLGFRGDSSRAVIDSLPKENKRNVLDLSPETLPFSFSFSDFKHYVILEENQLFHAYLTLRKALEGELWNNVEIISRLDNREEAFDCVHIFRRHIRTKKSRVLSIPKCVSLKESSVILIGTTPVYYGFFKRGESKFVSDFEDFHLDTVFSLSGNSIYLCLAFKRDNSKDGAVSFVDIALNHPAFLELEHEQKAVFIHTAFRIEEGEYTVTVPKEEIRESIIYPAYYLHRRNIRSNNNGVSLYDICRFDLIKEWKWNDSTNKVHQVETIPLFGNDPYLGEMAPIPGIISDDGYEISTSCILLDCSNIDYKRPLFACRLSVEEGKRVFVPSSVAPIVVDPERYDWQFILMILQKYQLAGPRDPRKIWFPAILDLILIPNIPIEEQRKAVEDYLQSVGKRNDRNDDKIIPYSLLVLTPDQDGFESRFGETLKEARLNVIDYASDRESLEEILPKHFGKDIPVSHRVDAILMDLSIKETNRILIKLCRLSDDVQVCYFADSDSILGTIPDDFVEEMAIDNTLVKRDDFPSGLRRILDSRTSPAAKIREEYRVFFQAAGRLDQIHPSWKLSEIVMKNLLQGRTVNNINKEIRSLLSETLCRFFKDNHVVPYCLDPGAIPSLLADGKYFDSNSRLLFKLSDSINEKDYRKETWARYAFVTLFKLGNKESHDSNETNEKLGESALLLLMQVIIWFESVHDRYIDGKQRFKCYRQKYQDYECEPRIVREIEPGSFSVGDIPIGNKDGLRDGTVGILDERTNKFHILIQ